MNYSRYYASFSIALAGLGALFCLQTGLDSCTGRGKLEEVFELLRAEDSVSARAGLTSERKKVVFPRLASGRGEGGSFR